MTAPTGEGLFDVDPEATYKTPDGARRVGWVLPDMDPADHRRGPVPPATTGPDDAPRPPRWWEAQAEQIIQDLARAGSFTSDDLRERLPQVSPSNNEIGAMFRRLAAEGRIRCVGYEQTRRPEGRGRLIRRWATR